MPLNFPDNADTHNAIICIYGTNGMQIQIVLGALSTCFYRIIWSGNPLKWNKWLVDS